ncbi:MAG: RteC domain-containing protein [Ignavibacteriae bacterium]|nr:RteC domain-containing protein [Ignavibacteriota bacterium]
MEQKLYALDDQNQDKVNYYRKAITITSQSLLKLKELIIPTTFIRDENEIAFYKEIKPVVLSKLIYYTTLCNLEVKRPNNSVAKTIKYYKRHIDKFQGYIDTNIEFYYYYKSGNKDMDQQYFTRINFDLKYYPEMYNYYTDPVFNTTHDTMLATIMAYENLIIELKSEIQKLRRKITNGPGSAFEPNLDWTANKIDLVELIYALHSSGASGYGQINLKKLTTACEQLFNIKLHDYSRKFLEIRSRTSGQTKFLDKLKESLERKMQQFDE